MTWQELLLKIPTEELDKPVKIVIGLKIFNLTDVRDFFTSLPKYEIEDRDLNPDNICLYVE